MKIELICFDGCPSWQKALENLESALQLERIQGEIDLIQVQNDNDAQRLRFLGSPHFRGDGRDLWPEDRDTYSLGCRVYATPEGIKGVPTVEMLREQLGQFKRA